MSQNNVIPKIIHYCWFGHGKKPPKVMKCMKSWEKHLHGYRFMEWNESNFDVTTNTFTKEAYDCKKYAFVSDYVRLYALYHYGGIYLDTDVEVIKPLDPLLKHEAFSGFEDDVYLQSGTMGAVKGHPWVERMLAYYDNRNFLLSDGTMDLTTNTSIMTEDCRKLGLIPNGTFQEINLGVVFYPRIYFSPYDYINGGNYITKDSYTIHHFAKSWLPTHVRLRSEVKKIVGRYLGPKVISNLRTMFWNK